MCADCMLLGPDIWPKAYLAGINYPIMVSPQLVICDMVNIRDITEIRVLTEICILDEIIIDPSESADDAVYDAANYEPDALSPKIKPGKVPKKNNGKRRYYYKKKKGPKNIE